MTRSSAGHGAALALCLALGAGFVEPAAAQHGVAGGGAGHFGGSGYFGRHGGYIGHGGGIGDHRWGYSYSGSHRWPTHFGRGIPSHHYPHGGWDTRTHYYYYPHLGFGTQGHYSWYYGRPYRLGYPYSSYHGPWYYDRWYFGLPRYDGSFRGGYDGSYGNRARREDGLLAEEERLATLSLRIEPNEAALYLDGNPIGTAEHFSRHRAELRLPPGTYLLEAAVAGYAPLSEELQLKPRERVRLGRQLQKSSEPVPDLNSGGDPARAAPSERPTGKLTLSVSPPTARVLLDGRFLCFGSMVSENRYLHNLPAGPHTLEVSQEGYRPAREEIIASPLRPLERRIVLERQQPR